MYDNRPCGRVVGTRFAPLALRSDQEASETQGLSHSQGTVMSMHQFDSSHDGCAAVALVRWPHNTQGTPSKPGLRLILSKIDVTSKPPVGDISVVTLIRTDTTLDHSQKAEKVCHECTGIDRQSNQTLCYWLPPLLCHWQLMRK